MSECVPMLNAVALFGTHPLATWFVDPLALSDLVRLLTFVPLAAAISIVYRCTRSSSPKDVFVSSFNYFMSMLLGIISVSVALWVIVLLRLQ